MLIWYHLQKTVGGVSRIFWWVVILKITLYSFILFESLWNTYCTRPLHASVCMKKTRKALNRTSLIWYKENDMTHFTCHNFDQYRTNVTKISYEDLQAFHALLDWLAPFRTEISSFYLRSIQFSHGSCIVRDNLNARYSESRPLPSAFLSLTL